MAIDADLNGVIANVRNGVGHWKRMATRLARTLAEPQARSGTGRTERRAVATSGPKYRHDRTVTSLFQQTLVHLRRKLVAIGFAVQGVKYLGALFCPQRTRLHGCFAAAPWRLFPSGAPLPGRDGTAIQAQCASGNCFRRSAMAVFMQRSHCSRDRASTRLFFGAPDNPW